MRKKIMGNTYGLRPEQFSDAAGPRVYRYHSMAAYRQTSQNADTVQVGNTKIGIGVKLLQEYQPGPNMGQMYVVNNAGKKVYFTKDNKMLPQANQIIQSGKNFGNGMAVSITGNPATPHYQMFYAPHGDSWTGSNQWTPITINSKKDILQAVRGGDSAQSGKFANMFGDASINPYGAAKGADFFTGLAAVGKVVGGIASQLILPIAELGLDTFVPFSSVALQLTGANNAIQGAINSVVRKGEAGYQSTHSFDPNIANIIRDPRLTGFMQQQSDSMHQYITEFGDKSYKGYQGLAQQTPSQILFKARQLAAVNENNYVQQQSQKLIDTTTKLQGVLHDHNAAEILQHIHTGLSMAGTNEQKMNVINHFTGQVQKTLLPLLDSIHSSAPLSSSSAVPMSKHPFTLTSSAQVSHESLSINGADSSMPNETVITA